MGRERERERGKWREREFKLKRFVPFRYLTHIDLHNQTKEVWEYRYQRTAKDSFHTPAKRQGVGTRGMGGRGGGVRRKRGLYGGKRKRERSCLDLLKSAFQRIGIDRHGFDKVMTRVFKCKTVSITRGFCRNCAVSCYSQVLLLLLMVAFLC